jgi:hypothetical protein
MLARKVLLGLALVLVLAVATPAMAADPFKGFYGTLDLALTQPVGLDQHYANEVDWKFLDPNTHNHTFEAKIDRLVLNNEDPLTWGAAAGYSWGKMGALQVSYWGFGSNDYTSETTNKYIYATVAGYTPDVGGAYLDGSSYYGSRPPAKYRASSDTRAQIWDLDYIRPMVSGEKFSINWVAGLRVAQYEENRYFEGADFYYGDGYIGVSNLYVQKHRQHGDAWGFKVGAIANMDFTKHIGMVADLSVSFLQARTKGDIVSCYFDGDHSDNFGCGENAVDDKDHLEGNADSQRAEIRDYGVKAVWHQGPVDIFLGFKSSNWDGLVSDPVPPIGGDNYGIGQAGSSSRDSIAFNSWHLGATWKIGG